MTPVGELDGRYSSPGAAPTPWTVVTEALERAEIFWISTVRPDGRPHVTPLIAIWLDDAIHFTTGAEERKALNLASNPTCTMTTGCNALNDGLDVVVEGKARRNQDAATLQRLADLYKTKYDWTFTVKDGTLTDGDHPALVFTVTPSTIFAFNKGEPFAQTRWQFEPDAP
jgi:general stress protein 26